MCVFSQSVVLVCMCADVPNAGDGLKRLSFKQEWDVDLRNYMKKLDEHKPVILCGDLNVAHQDIGQGSRYRSRLMTWVRVHGRVCREVRVQ